ncbi:histidine triad nucleotide-binding protein [Desulfosporosinus sp.]|uniref:histidine triad nucleotide-binding protein n=1 Tax=Desulfosporosinus sp. TaxID=157907 RepID=UPI000E8E8D76|nr:histidine triad nucleotide-binding protein [Desulfosporosinus sp.]MBC2721061.1 histidine triad nucleotide-binding protein [Desulfosporosinus sp.]MBC2725617.1 histidine triad nucleotide-binding protein [Desulfosporosinus sp.]HBV88125.1 histidine triad nucleotide-binding protein [Desulfosporosinus sp.]
MSDCIFCKIAQGTIPSEIAYEDDELIAFKDIQPLAPVHLVIIPKIHLRSLNDVKPENEGLIGHLFGVIKRLAEEFGVAESGYRVVTNTGTDGGQVVGHLHFHLIGGQALNARIG